MAQKRKRSSKEQKGEEAGLRTTIFLGKSQDSLARTGRAKSPGKSFATRALEVAKRAMQSVQRYQVIWQEQHALIKERSATICKLGEELSEVYQDFTSHLNQELASMEEQAIERLQHAKDIKEMCEELCKAREAECSEIKKGEQKNEKIQELTQELKALKNLKNAQDKEMLLLREDHHSIKQQLEMIRRDKMVADAKVELLELQLRYMQRHLTGQEACVVQEEVKISANGEHLS